MRLNELLVSDGMERHPEKTFRIWRCVFIHCIRAFCRFSFGRFADLGRTKDHSSASYYRTSHSVCRPSPRNHFAREISTVFTIFTITFEQILDTALLSKPTEVIGI